MMRCAGCGKRIRDNHPHVGLEDYVTGRERAYHAKEACQKRLRNVVLDVSGAGKVLLVHHYHTCNDEASDFDCYAGCFREVVLN